MNANEFQTALASALGVCRAAAAAKLPIEDMFEYIQYAIDEGLESPSLDELEAIHTVVEVVADVAAIGDRLPAEPTPIQVPNAPDGHGVPLPTNLTD
jgi:hypothetical protein